MNTQDSYEDNLITAPNKIEYKDTPSTTLASIPHSNEEEEHRFWCTPNVRQMSYKKISRLQTIQNPIVGISHVIFIFAFVLIQLLVFLQITREALWK